MYRSFACTSCIPCCTVSSNMIPKSCVECEGKIAKWVLIPSYFVNVACPDQEKKVKEYILNKYWGNIQSEISD